MESWELFPKYFTNRSGRSGRSDSADLISTNQDKKEKDLQNPLENICNSGLKKSRGMLFRWENILLGN